MISCEGQNKMYQQFIESFKPEKTDEILKFGKLAQIRTKMTKKEALSFVYSGDTSKLFCKQQIVDMETEKVVAVTNEVYLPMKCGKLDMSNYFLIAYTTNQCIDVKKPVVTNLVLDIVSKDYKKTDSKIVYNGDEYEAVYNGLLNPSNGYIFIIGNIGGSEMKKAQLFLINSTSLKFELVDEKVDVIGDTDDFSKFLVDYGWSIYFQN